MEAFSDESQFWDYVILTAPNAQIAKWFEVQLKKRHFPSSVCVGVVPDPVGERVGNGGAMLGAMRFIAEAEGKNDFTGIRALVILSSGDSKRVPQYSGIGKVFSPVPRLLDDNRGSTIFDELMISTSPIVEKISSGMLVLSGDVILDFDASKLSVREDSGFAIAFSDDAEEGTEHGVFLQNTAGDIQQVWHKLPLTELYRNTIVDDKGKVNIDTGAVFFTSNMLEDLFSLVCDNSGVCTEDTYRRYVNGKVAPSLYVDFFYPMAEYSTYEGYMKEIPECPMCDGLLQMREQLWKVLRKYRLQLARFEDARFIHFGTTAEVMRLMSTGIKEYENLGWTRQVGGGIPLGYSEVASYFSTIENGARIGKGVYLENSRISSSSVIGEGSMICGVDVDGEVIPPMVVLHMMRLQGGRYVARIFSVDDNPKKSFLFGCPIPDGTILWDAKVYRSFDNPKSALDYALSLYQKVKSLQNWDFLKEERSESFLESLNSSFNKCENV